MLAVACGSGARDGFDVIDGRQDAVSYAIEATVPELLANPSTYDATIVEGVIVQIDDGVGMLWTLDEYGEEEREILAFDDVDSMVRSVHVTMTIRNVIAGAPADRSTLRFGLGIDDEGDAQALRDGFIGQSFIAFLNESAVFDYESGMHGVAFDGGLLCRRDDDHALDCPALDDSLMEALDIGSVTVQDLEPSD